jgi:hypothetical protein
LAGNKRYASIILNKGILSRKFLLERGRPQGDIISPVTFNFCIQILLFKLELCTDIKKIPRAIIPVENILENTFFMHESHRETSKTETLADDNTAITLLDITSLRKIKTILEDFGMISGLRCNVSKTVLMPTEIPTREELAELNELGYEISDSFTLLGFKICRNLNNLSEIFSNIKEKIRNLIAFWERFRLSLPGRITILKTCLVSQLCYTGCILPVPENILSEIQTMIDGFVKKNLKVSIDRIYLPPELGGLGCLNLKTFLRVANINMGIS